MSKKFLESGVHVSSNREFVETLYKNWAETYDQEIEKNLYSTPNRIASILAQTEANKGIKVLDYGCGTGLSGLALKKVGFRNLVGIDPSDEMLQKAEEKKIYKSLPKDWKILYKEHPNIFKPGDKGALWLSLIHI